MIVPFVKALYRLDHRLIGNENEYGPLLTLIEGSALGGQIYHLLQESGRMMDVPAFFRRRLVRVYESCFFQNLLIKRETEALLRKLDDSGIAVIPLKGTVMAERYFGHFAARGTSDIDLLVKREQLDEAIRCVREAGFDEPIEDSPVHYHTEWRKEAAGLPEPLTVELHWSFVQQGSAGMDLEAVWACSEPVPDYGSVRALTPDATFYSLCLHGASHQMDSFKYALDLTHMICRHRDRIDLRRVMAMAERDHTLARVKAVLSIVYRLIPELARVLPLPLRPKHRFWTERFMSLLPDSAQARTDDGEARERFKLRRLLFTLSILDNWRYRAAHLRGLMLPSGELAKYSVEGMQESPTLTGTYYRLYRQRLRKLFGG